MTSTILGDLTVRAASIQSHTPFKVSKAERYKAIEAAYERIKADKDKKGARADASIIVANLAGLLS